MTPRSSRRKPTRGEGWGREFGCVNEEALGDEGVKRVGVGTLFGINGMTRSI